jgi:luciferase-like monooxygenase
LHAANPQMSSFQWMANSRAEQIVKAVSAWDDVSTEPGRFGSTRFMVGRRELGHMHEAHLDLPMPKTRKAELLEQGSVQNHRYTPPTSGWVTLAIQDEADVQFAIELLREQYERTASARSQSHA